MVLFHLKFWHIINVTMGKIMNVKFDCFRWLLWLNKLYQWILNFMNFTPFTLYSTLTLLHTLYININVFALHKILFFLYFSLYFTTFGVYINIIPEGHNMSLIIQLSFNIQSIWRFIPSVKSVFPILFPSSYVCFHFEMYIK